VGWGYYMEPRGRGAGAERSVISEFLIYFWTCNVGCCEVDKGRSQLVNSRSLDIVLVLLSGHVVDDAICRQFGSSYVGLGALCRLRPVLPTGL
jgi:hypothetical protein